MADKHARRAAPGSGPGRPSHSAALRLSQLQVDVDRTKAAQGGYTERDVATSLLNTLSGSFQITPMFFLNWNNGVNYNLVAQTPQYKMDTLQDLQNIPINRASSAARRADQQSGSSRREILDDLASVTRGHEMARRQPLQHPPRGRYLRHRAGPRPGRRRAAMSQRILDDNNKVLPRGTFVTLRGQVDTMRSSYIGLLGGLVFAIVLVYLLIVVNFQTWLDPFIIITALPAALAGIVLFLFLTHTTLSVPALMGAIMCMGVATANSILVVSFAKERLRATWRRRPRGASKPAPRAFARC